MDIENLGNLLDLLEIAYGKKALYEDSTKEKKLVLWETMFANDDPVEVAVAVKDCIATLQFPPKIADIKSRISQHKLAGQFTEMEAWALVRKAIDASGTKEETQKAFDALPKIIQRTIVEPKQLKRWRQIDEYELETVVQSNFMRSYKVMRDREASYHALPADLQQLEAWKIAEPKVEEPKALPMTTNKYDENGNRILNIGFEPPEYMMTKVKIWMDMGVSDAEIRKACVNWGTYEPIEIPEPEPLKLKEGEMSLEDFLKLYPFEYEE